MLALGFEAHKQQVLQIMKAADKTGQGHIHYNEFRQISTFII